MGLRRIMRVYVFPCSFFFFFSFSLALQYGGSKVGDILTMVM